MKVERLTVRNCRPEPNMLRIMGYFILLQIEANKNNMRIVNWLLNIVKICMKFLLMF